MLFFNESDVVCLCCDYSEYKDLNSFLDDYEDFKGIWVNNIKEGMHDKENKEAIAEEISDKTTLIKFRDDIDAGFLPPVYSIFIAPMLRGFIFKSPI